MRWGDTVPSMQQALRAGWEDAHEGQQEGPWTSISQRPHCVNLLRTAGSKRGARTHCGSRSLVSHNVAAHCQLCPRWDPQHHCPALRADTQRERRCWWLLPGLLVTGLQPEFLGTLDGGGAEWSVRPAGTHRPRADLGQQGPQWHLTCDGHPPGWPWCQGLREAGGCGVGMDTRSGPLSCPGVRGP